MSSMWLNYIILNDVYSFRLCFSEKCKRLDIRLLDSSKPTIHGVSLTKSEFSFVHNCIKNSTEGKYFDVKVTKISEIGWTITKKGRTLTTFLRFWKVIEPYIPAALYLASKDIPVDTLYDIYLLASNPLNDLQAKKINSLEAKCNSKCYLNELGFDTDITRKINSDAVIKFADTEPEVFKSLLLYK